MDYACPRCGKTNTAATYNHRCIRRNWFTVVCPAQTEIPGKGPGSVPCPDGLVDCTDLRIRRDSSLPVKCTGTGSVPASQLYCPDCKTTTVYTATPTQRRGGHPHARK
jgi:hypothetical protein